MTTEQQSPRGVLPNVLVRTTIEVPDVEGNTALRLTRNGTGIVVEAVRAPRGKERKPIQLTVLREAVGLLGD